MSEPSRRQFLGAAAALATLPAATGDVDDRAAADGGTEAETIPAERVGGPPGERYRVDKVVAADVWDGELDQARMELTQPGSDLERAAELMREGARKLEEREWSEVERPRPPE